MTLRAGPAPTGATTLDTAPGAIQNREANIILDVQAFGTQFVIVNVCDLTLATAEPTPPPPIRLDALSTTFTVRANELVSSNVPARFPTFYPLRDLSGGTVHCDYTATPPEGIAVKGSAELRLALLQMPPRSGSSCSSNGTTVCAQGDRFEVTLEFTAPDGRSGVGTVMSQGRTDEGGRFAFTNPFQFEVGVLVVNQCDANGHFAVRIDAATPWKYIIKVKDKRAAIDRIFIDNPFERQQRMEEAFLCKFFA